MTPDQDLAALGRSAPERRSSAQPLLWLPVVAALVLSMVGSLRPLWLDEVATVNMSLLPISRLIEVLGDIDAVHGLYYLGMHAWTAALGTDPMVLRLPSALATAAATGAVVLIGQRLAGTATAVAGGMAYALLPIVTDFGMEARSYALASALVAWASACLVLAVEGNRRLLWILYGVTAALATAVFLYASLVVLAHAVTLAWARASRSMWRAFLLSALIPATAGLFVGMVAASQRGQLSWISPTGIGTILKAPMTWTPPMLGATHAVLLTVSMWALVAAGTVVWWRNRRGILGSGKIELPQLALPWLVLPAMLLMAVSLVVPLFLPRYVLFSAPALALLIGYALNAIRRPAALVASGLLLALCIPAVVLNRTGDGRDAAAAKLGVIAEHGRTGDIVMTTPYFYMPVISRGLGSEFLGVQESGSSPNPITLVEASESLIVKRLASADRIWLIPFDDAVEAAEADRHRRLIRQAQFSLVAEYEVGNATVQLYEREDGQIG